MTSKSIIIRGARTHNLKNVSVTIPRDQLVVVTGLSGSGKSSLAFDTLYAEGQRRYVESLSSYARQFLSMMDKPDVDHIDGLSPAISIEQKTVSHNPRSTVGTVTEIYDYLRLLYARVGKPHCPVHHIALSSLTVSQMVDAVLGLPEGTKFLLLAPLVEKRKGEHKAVFAHLRAEGFIRVRVNGVVTLLEDVSPLPAQKQHTIEAVVDRMAVRATHRVRLAQSLETALALSRGIVKIISAVEAATASDTPDVATALPFSPLVFSAQFACSACGFSVPELTPRHFSFNNPLGACPLCKGLGMAEIFDPDLVVARPQFSLSEGAVAGWDPQHAYYYSLLSGVAAHYAFDLSTPFEQLSTRVQRIILYGSGREKIRFELASNFVRSGRSPRVKCVPFEGVIPVMTRRYRETESALVREEMGKYLRRQPCRDCQGGRLAPFAAHVQIHGVSLPQLCHQSIKESMAFFTQCQWEGQDATIATPIVEEIRSRLCFLIDVGLGYLTLHRSAETLSGGESQRIRLASQIGSGLVGVLYVLDEPTIGLHAYDTTRLLKTLLHLRDLGNTVLMVEHDEAVMRAADHILDLGPGAGVQGGELVGQGRIADLLAAPQSITGQYLSGERVIAVPDKRIPPQTDKMLQLTGVSLHNLKQMDVAFPLGLMVCVTGVSGSGKSTLVNDTLYPFAAVRLNRALLPVPGHVKRVEGLSHLDKVVAIDQSPIGRTPRSNPATYTGLFSPIRELFAATEEARSRGYAVGRFSFNVDGGRCAACRGEGLIKVEMHFLSDVYVVCDHCQGRRYNRETLEIRYKGQTIDAVLSMTVKEALTFFDAIPVLKRKLNTLVEVGLSYLKLGQSATTLSGGEAQRLKLARELSKKATGKTLYILDEPTTGLHFEDVRQLLVVLHRLRDQGNTVIVIEHNLDVIKTADWLIDLGPGGGYHGGTVVAEGTPEQLITVSESLTGQCLKPLLVSPESHMREERGK